MASAKPIPEGMHTLTPNLVVRGAAEAIEVLRPRLRCDGGHADACTRRQEHLARRAEDWRLDSLLNDEMPGMGAPAPSTAAPAPATMWLYVTDSDAAYRRAVSAGAKSTMPPADMFWGDCCSGVMDPYGYQWSFSTHVKDLTADEMRRAGEEFARSMGQGARP